VLEHPINTPAIDIAEMSLLRLRIIGSLMPLSASTAIY